MPFTSPKIRIPDPFLFFFLLFVLLPRRDMDSRIVVELEEEDGNGGWRREERELDQSLLLPSSSLSFTHLLL